MHITCLQDNLAILSLHDSKGAKRPGDEEVVFISDPMLIRVLRSSKQSASAEAWLFDGNYRDFNFTLQDAAAFFGLSHLNLTPHGLRRGSATWHCALYQSYDRTQQHGRWQQTMTAKIYIDEDLTEIG